jgi:hypothetical protein
MSLPTPALVLAALCTVAPLAAGAQEGGGTASRSPSGLTASFSLGGGGELGLGEDEEAGLGEVELVAGWEPAGHAFRPELGLVAGFHPEGSVALRPGVRFDLPGLPLALRVAIDASTARGDGLRWRWLLVGLSTEIRFTSLLGLFAEVDSGAPLGSDFGVPLVARAGASFRF